MIAHSRAMPEALQRKVRAAIEFGAALSPLGNPGLKNPGRAGALLPEYEGELLRRRQTLFVAAKCWAGHGFFKRAEQIAFEETVLASDLGFARLTLPCGRRVLNLRGQMSPRNWWSTRSCKQGRAATRPAPEACVKDLLLHVASNQKAGLNRSLADRFPT
jgi:hypothetical protein